MISFGCVRKISWPNWALSKIVQFVRDLSDQLTVFTGILIYLEIGKNDLTQIDCCTVAVMVKVSS